LQAKAGREARGAPPRGLDAEERAGREAAGGPGPEAQAARRELERQEHLLAAWEKEWRGNKLRAQARGRQPKQPDPETQQAILGLFEELGPGVGVRTLKGIYPNVPRRGLAEMLRDYREAWTRENTVLVNELKWTRAGRVWAMDYTEPPGPVDGVFSQILATRDLASGFQPRALPFETKSMEGTAAALESAFREHGAPLVLKSDNDGTLVGDKVQKVLDKWEVAILRSPPAYPEYNGSQEAGIGSLKTRAEHQAMRNGRPGEWTCDDVEAARLQANELSRPKGAKGPTPDQGWQARTRVTAEERQAFRNAVATNLAEELAQRATLFGPSFDPEGRVAAQRVSIVRALVALGYLKVRRRRIPPPIPRRIREKNK
jgi:hypothetical protein